jgi:hypothetical protein
MAELTNYQPTLWERLAYAIGGDSREGTQRARQVVDQAALPLAFTPAGFYDVGRTVAPDLGKLYDSLFNSSVQAPPRLNRDEFYAIKRSKRQTLEDAQKEAEAAARASPEYKKAMDEGRRTAAERLVGNAKTSAKGTWEASQATIPQEDTRIEADWNAYNQDFEDKRIRELSKGFSERNPGAATAMTLGGGLAAGLLTRGVFNKVNAYGMDLAKQAEKAYAKGDMAKYAQVASKAADWEKNAPWMKGGTAVGAATIPADLRMLTDVIDKKLLPEDAPARQRAEEKMSLENLPSYLGGFGWDVFSGGVSAFTGSKLAKNKMAPFEVRGVTARTRGLPARDGNPDELAKELADRAIQAELASQQLKAVRQNGAAALPPPAPVGGPPGMPPNVPGGQPPTLPPVQPPVPVQPQLPAPAPAPQVNGNALSPSQQKKLIQQLKGGGFIPAGALGYGVSDGGASLTNPLDDYFGWLNAQGAGG